MNVKDKLVTLEELRTGLDTKVNTSAIVNDLTVPDTAEKSVADAGVLTVTDAMAANARDLIIGIEPVQSGSGDPSPTNVRPITGWTGANIHVSAATTGGTTYPISWQTETGTVYGGTLDVTTGLLTVNMYSAMTDGQNDRISTVSSLGTYTRFWYYVSVLKAAGPVICDTLPTVSGGDYNSDAPGIHGNNTDYPNSLWAKMPTSLVGTTVSSVGEYLRNNPMQVVCKLATPQTCQLTPTQIALLLGKNNIWADVSGDSGTIALDYLALTGELTKKPLSAEMGNVLNDTKVNVTDIVNDLTSGGAAVPLSAEMGKTLNSSLTMTDMTNSCTWDSGFTYVHKEVFKMFRRVYIAISATATAFSNGAVILTLPSGMTASYQQFISGIVTNANAVPTGQTVNGTIDNQSDQLKVYISGSLLSSDYIVLSGCILVNT